MLDGEVPAAALGYYGLTLGAVQEGGGDVLEVDSTCCTDVEFEEAYIYDDYEGMAYYDEEAAYAFEAFEAAIDDFLYGSDGESN